MSRIVSRRVLNDAIDFMNQGIGPITIGQLAEHMGVGYNRAAEVTRYGTRHGYFSRTWHRGHSLYRPFRPLSRAEIRNLQTGDVLPDVLPRASPFTIANPGALAAPEITFGVEAEFDFIERKLQDDNGEPLDNPHYEELEEIHSDPGAHVRGWSARADGTCGQEIATPPWSSLDLAMQSTAEQWRYWMAENQEDDHDAVPYMIGENAQGNSSMGQHIHVGAMNRNLTRTEKTRIARFTLMEYPLIIAITANSFSARGEGYSSRRVGRWSRPGMSDDDHGMARSMSDCGTALSESSNGTGSRGHYYEISDSHHGTVEYRAQDSNVPQAILTAAWLLQQLAGKALEGEAFDGDEEVDFGKYNSRREHACERHGPYPEELREYLSELIAKIGDRSLDDLPASTKEVLFLALKKRTTVGAIFNRLMETTEQKFEYFKIMTTKPNRYIENLLEMTTLTEEQKTPLNALANECRGAHKLGDLLNTEADAPTELHPSGRQESGRFADQTWDGNRPWAGWFRLGDLQGAAAARLFEAQINRGLGPSVDANGITRQEARYMSTAQARQSPSKFWVWVAHGIPVDVWVEQ